MSESDNSLGYLFTTTRNFFREIINCTDLVAIVYDYSLNLWEYLTIGLVKAGAGTEADSVRVIVDYSQLIYKCKLYRLLTVFFLQFFI